VLCQHSGTVAILHHIKIDSLKLLSNPSHNQRHNKIDLRLIQRPSHLDSIPLLNTPPATGNGNVPGSLYIQKIFNKKVYNILTDEFLILKLPFL
jgi:hypothetical protein